MLGNFAFGGTSEGATSSPRRSPTATSSSPGTWGSAPTGCGPLPGRERQRPGCPRTRSRWPCGAPPACPPSASGPSTRSRMETGRNWGPTGASGLGPCTEIHVDLLGRCPSGRPTRSVARARLRAHRGDLEPGLQPVLPGAGHPAPPLPYRGGHGGRLRAHRLVPARGPFRVRERPPTPGGAGRGGVARCSLRAGRAGHPQPAHRHRPHPRRDLHDRRRRPPLQRGAGVRRPPAAPPGGALRAPAGAPGAFMAPWRGP